MNLLPGSTFSINLLDEARHGDAFCRLFQTVYGHPIDLDTWRWKYHGAPGVQCLQLIAEDQTTGEMVGHIGAVILPGRLNGNPVQPDVRWAQIGDIMVLASARGDMRSSGVYPQLVRHMQKALQQHTGAGVLLAYGFPGQRPFRLGQRMGYYRQIRQCKVIDYAPQPPAPRWHWRYWRAQQVWPLESGASLEQADAIEQALAVEPGLVKNARYLHWRYLAHPQRQYTFWWTGRHPHRPSGWLVTAASPDNSSLTLVDSRISPAERPAALQALLVAHPNQRIQGWLDGPPGQTYDAPIIATEFGTPGFHPQHPWPDFQPGDTDVY